MHRAKLFVNNLPTYDLRPITLEYTQTSTYLLSNSSSTPTSEVAFPGEFTLERVDRFVVKISFTALHHILTGQWQNSSTKCL